MPYKDINVQRAKALERKKKFKLENPEKFKEQKRNYERRKNTRENVRQRRHEYYLAHREQFINRAKLNRKHAKYPGEFFKNRQSVISDLTSCDGCGSKGGLQAHHITSQTIHESWNLMPLCPNCHKLVHTVFGKKNLYRENVLKHLVVWAGKPE